MAVAERKPQRSVKPVVIDSLTDFLQFVCVGLVERAVFRIIQTCKPFQFKFLGRCTEIERTQVRITHFRNEVVAELDLFVADTLSFHDNDSVGALFAVENRGGSIFQHIDTFNVEDVEVIEFLHGNLHAVQHDERIVYTLLTLIGNQCVGSADEDGRDGVRVGACCIVLDHHHTWSQGGDAGNQVRRRQLRQFLSADGGGRTGKRFLGLGIEAVHHDRVQRRYFQRHIQPGGTADIEFLRFSADE